MADFWRGVAQGFGPAYQASLSRREKMDAILAQQKREDDRQEILDKRHDAALALAAGKERGRIAGLLGAEGVPLGRGADYVPTELESQMHSIAQAKAQRVVREGAEKRMRDAEATAAGQGATIPPALRRPGMTPSDVLRMGSEWEKADKLAEEKRKDEAAITLKRTLAPQHPKTPELSTEDAVDGIIQMRAQLGPEGSRGPQPSRQALLEMKRGPIMQLYGAFTDKIAVQKRERDIADSKEKGTGLSGSTRGYKAAAEAGVRYDELLKDVEKDLKAGKEPDPLKMREMKSNMAHVMAFYGYPGRLVPPHLEDLVRGAGRTPNNAILTDMANAHELSMYGESLAKDIKHLSEKYGKDKMTAFIGPIQKPLSELLTVFGIDDENEDRFIVNRLSQKYQDMANYKLFIESGKTVTEQEFKRLKTVVGDPTREDFLEKLLGFAQLQTERTQRKLKAYKDVGLRFNPDLEKAIYKGATPQGSGGLSSAEDTELQKLKEAKAANLMDDASKRRYLELLKKLAEEN